MKAKVDPLVIAFVQGAKWWEFKRTQGTMWPSDRDAAEMEAERLKAMKALGDARLNGMFRRKK